MVNSARFTDGAGIPARSFLATLTSFVLALACLSGSQGPSFAAVEWDGQARDGGAATLHVPFGIAADSLGNFYVADPGKHHVVKFDADGTPKKIIGKYGFGNGQLYSPQGVAVGLHSNGDTLVYVADTNNSRVVVFDDEGRYVRKFGDLIPTNIGLLNPGGIAYLKNKSTPGGLILVADTRNHRIVSFTHAGAFVREYRCPTCPANGIRPLGVSARYAPNGTLQIFASDEFTGLVQVINNGGGWVRSIGRKGVGKGELRAPDDVAVDEDGNVWVADPAFGLEQISKFGPDGTFRYALNNNGGGTTFTQPHGVGLDEQGNIYVAESGGGAYRFRERAPVLLVNPHRGDPYWVNTKGAWFNLGYSGIEQTCRGGGSAVIRTPAGSTQTFTIDGGPTTISNLGVFLKLDMTAQQATRIANVWKQGKQIGVSAKFTARCQDGKLLQKTRTFSR